MVDTADLGSAEYIRAGSSPVSHTCGFTALGTIPLVSVSSYTLALTTGKKKKERKKNYGNRKQYWFYQLYT